MHFLNEKFCILIRISLKFVPQGPIDNKWALVRVMAWRWIGGKQLTDQGWSGSLMHICGTRGDELMAELLLCKLGQHYCFWCPGGRFKNAYELLNLRALKISMLYKSHIFQCMGKIFCVEFQRVPLKFHTKYLAHTLKNKSFMKHWNFKSS